MAIVSGVLGSVTLPTGYGTPTSNLHALGWRLSLSTDVLDTTSWTSSTNSRTYVQGLATGTGSVDIFYDDTENLGVAGALGIASEGNSPVAFVLTAHTGRTWSFNGLITGISAESSKAGLYQGTLDFQVSGDVTTA